MPTFIGPPGAGVAGEHRPRPAAVLDAGAADYAGNDTAMPPPPSPRAALYALLGDEHGETLFDFLADVQFWIKDAAGRYVRVNRGLLMNYGFPDESAIVGRTDRDLFPPHLADQYQRDDRTVLAGG